MIYKLFRAFLTILPAATLIGVGLFTGAWVVALVGVAVAGIHYELYRIRKKVENALPWY